MPLNLISICVSVDPPMSFAEGCAFLISSSCCNEVGLYHLFLLFPKASGLNSCLRSCGGKINSVSGLYSMKPGGVNRFMGWSLPPALSLLQHPPPLAPFAPFFSMQHPPPPFAFALPHPVLTLKLCAASRIGLYPVHLHRLPSKASSTSCSVGASVLRRRAYKLMTMPGVQKPHWLPFPFAIRSCAGCGLLTLPIPSTVMTCLPSTLTSGARHAFTEA